MKFTSERPFADPEKAARRLMEIASTVEPVRGAASSDQRAVSIRRQGYTGGVRRGSRASHRTRPARTHASR